MKTSPIDQHAGEHRVHVAGEQAGGEIVADARPGEDRLGQHRAFQQEGVGERDHGDELDQDVAERMPPDDPPARQAPCARAATIYSWPSCSSMKLRVIRLI